MVDIVNIGLKVDSRDVKTGTKELDRFGKQAGKTQTATGKLVKAIKGALIGAIVGLAASLKKAVGIFTEFEKSLHELSAITGAAGKDLEFYKKQSLEMAKATGRSASDVVSAYKLIASAKPDLLESKEALSAVTKEVLTLAKAATLDLETAAISLGSSLNQFGADASEASRFINVLAAGSKLGASEIGDTAEALKMAGAVAKSVGLSFEETNAAIQTLGAVSLKGTMAGTGLRAVLLRLSTQSRNEFNPEIVGLTSALKNLGEANLSTAEKADLFGQEAITSATALISQASAVAELTKNLTGTNIAYEQAAINSDTLDTRLGKMQAKWEEMSIVMVEKLMPALEGVIDLFTKAADWTGGIADAVIGAGTAIGEFAAKVVLGLQGIDAYNIKTSESVKTLSEQIKAQESVVRSGADALALSMLQYEEITKHIEAMEKVSGVLPSTLDLLRQKQEEAAASAKMHSDALAEEKKKLDDLRASAGISTENPMAGGVLGDPSEEARRAAIERRMQEEEALLDWELDRAIEQQEEMEEALEEKRLEQELNRAIHDEEELERIYEHNERKLEAQMEYYDRLYDLETGSQQAALDFVNSVRMMDLQGAIQHGTLMLSNLAKQSKAMFNIHKAFSLAQAVVSLPSAVIQSFENGGGYPWGLIPAGLMLAEGLSQIKKISSASFGGGASAGGSIGGGGGGGSIQSPAQSATVETTPINEPVKHDVSIVVSGGLHSDEDVRNLVSRINEIQEDMGQVSLVTS